MPVVNFFVQCSETLPGQSVAIVGSWNDWGVSDCIVLNGKEFPRWRGELVLPGSEPQEYKYVLVDKRNQILRWEQLPNGGNRELSNVKDRQQINDGSFGHPAGAVSSIGTLGKRRSDNMPAARPLQDISCDELDGFEKALVAMNREHRSWRLRLSFIREALCDEDIAKKVEFDSQSLDCLVTIFVYLTFLSTGQVPCREDHGHHRPNHHASEAQQIESCLNALMPELSDEEDVLQTRDDDALSLWIPYVARNIYPQLPSFATQFTVSVPLTRIRDIAHRGDIPHDLKQEIKHTLQNKLHRCAGPEDLKTCENILDRVSHGGYSEDFVQQLKIFHGELREFFNASSVDDYLRFLCSDAVTKASRASDLCTVARTFLQQKQNSQSALQQMKQMTKLRTILHDLIAYRRNLDMNPIDLGKSFEPLSPSFMQKIRLADCAMDSYLFQLLASVAKDVEACGFDDKRGSDHDAKSYWSLLLNALQLACQNMRLSYILPNEMRACVDELHAILMGLEALELDITLLHRIKAAIDRTTRATETFSVSISEVSTRRVSSLSAALDVDKRAASVFAEAVIRSSVAFQASRLADCASSCVRKQLNLPPWNSLYNGTARGKIKFIDSVSDIQSSGDCPTEPIILISRDASGDEDIPCNVKGIVLGRSLPHLSHLGVRARQAGVVFVCAEDSSTFDDIWNGSAREMTFVELVVTPTAGLSMLQTVSNVAYIDTPRRESAASLKDQKQLNIEKFDRHGSKILQFADVTRSNSAGKCSNVAQLAKIAKRYNQFRVPTGVVIPFGVFEAEKARHKLEISRLENAYQNAWGEGDDLAATRIAEEHRKFVLADFSPDEVLLRQIGKNFKPGTQVMVRSSANCEDLEDMSGAGLYDSIADVDCHSVDALKYAVKEVWASMWTRRAASSRSAYSVPHDNASMAVLVQEMICSDLSFVAFSVNPVDPTDREHIYIEAALGMGETLASAGSKGQPYRFRICRDDTKAILIDALSSYSFALVPQSNKGNASSSSDCAAANGGQLGLQRRRINYSTEKMTTDAVFRRNICSSIANMVLILEKELGGFQDIEGAVKWLEHTDPGEKFELFVVQARPQIL